MGRDSSYGARDRSLVESRIPAALRTLAFLALSATLAQGADALNYYKNYFVTGDYTVAGVGLRGTGVNGWATGTITITGVPCTSGVGAWTFEPCSTHGAVASDIVAAYLYWQTEEETPKPAAVNGYFDGHAIMGAVLGNPNNPACWSSGGNTGPPGSSGRVYRADVMQYLQVDQTNSIRLANGAHTVKLVDSGGNGNGNILFTNGASLLVVYKVVVPGRPYFALLKSVVIYDGAFTLSKGSAAFTQTIGGFYQATGAGATMSQIVSNGEPGFNENLTVNGGLVSTHPFTGGAGVRWDNPSFQIDLERNDSSYSTQVTSNGSQVCLTWAAVVTSTPVVDSDSDGLLDVWETNGIHLNPGTATTPATFGGCSDYKSEPCVDLPAMGANPYKQDIFLQLDWMHGTGDGTGGIDNHGTHDHMPTQNALGMVCSTYALHGIALHFDVGNNYQGQPCIVTYKTDSYGNQLAQGGSDIAESTLVCTNTSTLTCTYQELYPVMSFKRGLLSVRDGNPVLNLPGHFAHNRKDSFHYVLFTHALSGPFSSTGVPLTKDPSSVSGIADRPGGDIMISLGLWRTDVPATDQVGTDLIQAGTLMHELGHNLDLSHYGLNRTPNCAPQYASVMNYLYQTRGLTDAAGKEHIDYSYGLVFPALSENYPTSFLFPLQYRVRYYAPLNGAVNTAGQAAKVYCDGSPITDGAQMIRLESSGLSAPDWSNGTGEKVSPPIDLNFDGVFGQTFTDQPDWFVLNLQQIGGRPNANGFSADVGFADEGFADEGFADEGFADEGFADEGFADEGVTDGDLDLDTNTLSGAPVPTALIATNTINSIQLTWTPPSAGKVVSYNIYRCAVISPATSCALPTTPFNTAPGGTATPSFTDTVNDAAHSGKGGSAVCSTSTCNNTTYFYQVTALISATVSGSLTTSESGPTNVVSSEVTHLYVLGVVPPPAVGAVAGPSQTYVYGVTIPAPTYLVYGDVASNLTTGVTCAYSPANPRNVGVYKILCSGPSPTLTPASGTDGVTYNAAYLSYISGVLTIAPAPLTANVTGSQTYGGANQVFSVSSYGPPSFVNGDSSSVVTGSLTCNTSALPTSNVGIYTISGCQGLSAMNYTIGYAYGNFTVNPAPQTIAFGPLPNMVFGAADFTVSATASSGLTVTFTASGTCTVTVATVHLTAPGSCTITASQPGGGNYLPALSVQQTFSVTVTTTYTSDGNLSDFTTGISTYAQFDSVSGLNSDLTLPYTPSAATVAAGDRVYGNGDNPAIIVEFPSAVSKIRVFPNIDHPGAAYDGYQYTVWGSNDGTNYTLLFDALSVNGSGEPFTLGSFTGTAPFNVNNVLTPGAGPGGSVGYIADFSFTAAYKYYRFGASTVAVNLLNVDQELTAVAALP